MKSRKNKLEKSEKYESKLEKILRSRLFWIVIIPLLIATFFVTYNLFEGMVFSLESIFGGMLFSLWMGLIVFPMAIISGIAGKIVNFGPYLTLATYSLYIIFICFVKKIDKRVLYWISLILLLLVVLGLRGCVIMTNNY